MAEVATVAVTHHLDESTWAARLTVQPPRLGRGGVAGAEVTGYSSQEPLSPAKCRELAQALLDAADLADRLDAAIGPHLRAADEALKSLQEG